MMLVFPDERSQADARTLTHVILNFARIALKKQVSSAGISDRFHLHAAQRKNPLGEGGFSWVARRSFFTDPGEDRVYPQ